MEIQRLLLIFKQIILFQKKISEKNKKYILELLEFKLKNIF